MGIGIITKHGSQKAITLIESNPEMLEKLKGIEILGISNQTRKEAINQFKEDIKTLKEITKLENTIKDITNKAISDIASINTTNKTHEEITKAIETKTAIALHTIAKDIINITNRNQEEPTQQEKEKITERAIYEASQKDRLSKLTKNNTTLQRLQSILSNNREATDKELTETLKHNDSKIKATAEEYIKRGDNPIKAYWVAKQLVKYNERYNLHMPEHQIEHIKTIGAYVQRNNAILQKEGYTATEAKMITHTEGEKLAMNYNARVTNSHVISKHEVERVQRDVGGEVSKVHVSGHGVSTSVNAGTNANTNTNANIVKHGGLGVEI